MKEANIVLFEDYWLSRYVKEALEQGGYNFKDDADRLGSFKDDLISRPNWDLIIVAAESRGGIRGEFFDYILQQLDSGAGLIMELWTLDTLYNGRIQPILEKCGLEFQDNWVNPSSRSVIPLVPENPIFHEPNEVSLGRFLMFWEGDVGDLIKKSSDGGDAIILGGTNINNKNGEGILATCMGGRMILQTFSTHDHRESDAVMMWQNYIYYALKNHFSGK